MERVLARIHGSQKGPTVIITCALHGNEGAGVKAVDKVIHEIQTNSTPLSGTILALIGNLNALSKNVRFVNEDLNRIWSREASQNIEEGNWHEGNTSHERREQIELYGLVKNAFEIYSGPFIFVDLHSVSSKTEPFITINDMLRNRKLAAKFPVPVILGLEEFIYGSFLNRVNALGHIAIGFEGGEHDDEETVENHASFVRLMLHFTEVLRLKQPSLEREENQLNGTLSKRFFEIRYRQELEETDRFKMEPNFENMERIKMNQVLAHMNGHTLRAPFRGRLFLPLYQNMGSDGFFIVRHILVIALKTSEFLRQIPWTGFLVLLPGVRRAPESAHTVRANRKTARFLTIPIFHLLGYRCRKQTVKYLFFVRREVSPHQ